MKPETKRWTGMSLLEVVIASAIMIILIASVASVFSAMTRGTAQAETQLLAQGENQRAFLALINDLQSTDPVGLDGSGNPYFKIVNYGSGTSNSIAFRRVEGFSVDVAGDMVTSVFGNPIQYFVDGENNLVRVQDGKTTVVGNRISAIKFSLSAAGSISIEITSYSGRGDRRTEVKNQIQVTPRNIQRI